MRIPRKFIPWIVLGTILIPTSIYVEFWYENNSTNMELAEAHFQSMHPYFKEFVSLSEQCPDSCGYLSISRAPKQPGQVRTWTEESCECSDEWNSDENQEYVESLMRRLKTGTIGKTPDYVIFPIREVGVYSHELDLVFVSSNTDRKDLFSSIFSETSQVSQIDDTDWFIRSRRIRLFEDFPS